MTRCSNLANLNRTAKSAAMVACIVLVGCSSTKLTSDLAAKVVMADIDDKDATIKVDGISQSTGTDAVVAANVLGTEMRLLFRRYDTGWRWEAIEGGIGGKTSADKVIPTLQEKARLARAKVWAAPLLDKYRETADTLSMLHGNMSRLTTEDLNQATWDARHKWMVGARTGNVWPDDKRADSRRRLDPPTDAWGNKIMWALNNEKRTGYVVSAGPDGKFQTSDDLACLFVGEKHWDTEYSKVLWDYGYEWLAPEGTNEALAGVLSENSGSQVTYQRIEPPKVIK